jgi:spermidine/putrescine transport system substrate-binding protein
MSGLSRRDLLRGGAGLALGAAGLSGCQLNSGFAASAEDTRKPFAKKVDGDLAYFNWAQYIDPALLKGFEKLHGVKVRESNFDSMPAMMAKLRAGIQYDVIFPTAEYVQRLVRGNQLRVIDRDELKNAGNVFSRYDNPWYDRESAHTVPYTMYATGLGYRADKVEGMTGSWRDLVDVDSDGRAFMLDDYQEGLGMANLVNDYDLNTVDPEELERSKDLLIDFKPQLRGYTSDTITSMASGNAWIQHLWNGDVVNIRNQVDNPEDFKFQKCTEGIPVGSDTFAIPVNAKHPGTALLFIEYMLEQENQAQNVAWVGYPMPYEGGAQEAFAGLVKDDPTIEVTVNDLDNGQEFETLEGEGRRAWDRAWTEVKVA